MGPSGSRERASFQPCLEDRDPPLRLDRANLARGLEIGDAVFEAQDYTWQALSKAFRPGMGQHLPDRLFWAREEDDAENGK